MADIIFYIFIFLFGLVIGSFLNCIIYRLEKGESAMKGRSYCPKCKHQLSWYDLIPALSFFILKGKCRYCNKEISWQYPLVELATGLLFLLIFNFQFSIFNQVPISNFQIFINTLFLFTISSILIIIFVYDLKHYIIPDRVIYPAIIIAGIFNFQFFPFNGIPQGGTIFNEFSMFKFSILSAILASGFFIFIVLATRGKGMGVGDVKLAFLMGLLLGWPNIFTALFFAFLIGAIIGVGLILAKKKTLKSEIPFGPFLVTGTFIALFWGEQLINFYLNLFV